MADVNALGETPLLSLLRSGSLKGVKELLSDVNQGDLLGETPLMEAACMGDKDLCLLLLQSRADVSQRNVQGQRAEDLAKAAHFVDIAELLASRRLSEAVPRPRGRGRALRQQCLEKDIPYDLLGQLAAANLLKDVELWQAMPLEELLEVCLQQGLETQSDREDLELRLKQMRLWRLLPLEALQDLCKKEASHVVAQMSKEKEGALSREELVEALSVANWGGQTSRQLIRKRCEEKGIPEEKLEDRSRAEQVLQEFERLEKLLVADLAGEYKRRGFPYADDLPRETIVSTLKEHTVYQELSLSHLRHVCKEKELAIKGEHRRADLLKMIAEESWREVEIPVSKMPSILVAQGLLDQVKRMEKKTDSQLRAELRRRQLPVEKTSSSSKLLSRLRRHLVWQQMSVEDLEVECRTRGLQWTPVTSKKSTLLHAGSNQKKEMLQLLHDWLSVEMLEGKGISVKLLGREAALAIFMEVEKMESMPRSFLEAEYELLGMPVEKLQDKEIIRRLRQSLIWSQLETDQLLEECEQRQLNVQYTMKLCDEERRQIVLDKLIISLGVDDWEKQGIPVSRLTGLDAAIGIVEELHRLEEGPASEVRETYKLLGLPEETLEKSVMISRLKHYMIFQELKPSEVRKECLKHSISATGNIDELIANLILKTCGFEVLEEKPFHWTDFQPPPRAREKEKPKSAVSGKVAAAFQQLGLAADASKEEVRRAYRKLALQHHPDKNPGLQEEAAKKFQQITVAYETIVAHLKR